MRGLDGNYLSMQGDASAKVQAAYLAEQGAQQVRMKAEAEESLRRLREEVQESEKGSSSSLLRVVAEHQENQSRDKRRELKERESEKISSDDFGDGGIKAISYHVDIRV